jgi:hypothetical protein
MAQADFRMLCSGYFRGSSPNHAVAEPPIILSWEIQPTALQSTLRKKIDTA